MPERTLKLTIAYEGTRFVGWQRQAAGESIQGLLEEAVARLAGVPVTVQGAGRTDAGVHALGQVASVRVNLPHDVETLLRALNAHLPADVRVLAVEDAPPEFHARFSARLKSYRYVLCHAPVVSPFVRPWTWHVPGRLDLGAMARAAAVLEGEHDFAAFQNAGSDTHGSVRTITSSRIVTDFAMPLLAQHAGLVAYEVSGTGFLRYMVRTIAGTLVEIGRGWREASNMSALLAGRERANAGATAPPGGLFLVRVDYD